MSLEDLFEIMDAFSVKNELFVVEKKVEMVNFATRRNNQKSDEKHSNGKVGNYKVKDWTNKQLAKTTT